MAARIKEHFITVLCIAMTVFHLIANIVTIEAMMLRAVHLGFVLVLIFLCYPFKSKKDERRVEGEVPSTANESHIIDYLLAVLSFACTAYVVFNYQYLVERIVFVSPLRFLDCFFGISLVILILIATRRTVGWSLTIVASIFILYGLFGQYLPGIFRHGGIRLTLMVDTLYMSTNGIFGSTLGMSATYIMLFIIFGALLTEAGIGQLFSNLANALTRDLKSGPAAAAVVSSALFGTVSGSATANVYTTGTFTIPMMMRAGYEPHFAGAVEAVASCGGQITPPVLGATAFVMADIAGLPYSTICLAAILPCILYYATMFIMIQCRAYRLDLQAVPFAEGQSVGQCLKDYGHLFVPIIVLIALMSLKFSTMYAVFYAILSVIPVSFLRKTTRLTWKKLLHVLESSAKNVLTVAIACAVAGIVQAMIVSSGIGFKFVTMILSLSANSVFLALLAIAVVCLLLGMGMPTTASYVLVAALAASALTMMGLSSLQAHMFIFYFATLSAITPPVALAAYAGASIAKAPIMKTGWTAARLGIIAFIIPFCFIEEPAILGTGGLLDSLTTLVPFLAGAACLSFGSEGYLFGHIKNNILRISFLIIGLGCMVSYPSIRIAAQAAAVALCAIRYILRKRTAAA